MPILSVSNATVTELFKGSAKFGRPSEKEGAGWIVTADKGNAIIQKQTFNNDSTSASASAVVVVRWTNYMGVDGMNGRILPGLPIHRQHDSVFFKTSSTTTRGNRHKVPFCFKFETRDEAEEFEAFWLLKNGSIALWKEQDAKKKEDINNPTIKVPLKDSTNAESNPVRNTKRKANPMIDGPLRKKKVEEDSLNLLCGGVDRSNDVENQPAFLLDGSANDVSDPHCVGAFKAVELMPTEVNINGKLRKIVKVKRSALKSITEDSIDNSNEEDQNDLNDDNSNDSNDDDSSNDSSGEDVIIDEEDAPQSQNWMTAFAP